MGLKIIKRLTTVIIAGFGIFSGSLVPAKAAPADNSTEFRSESHTEALYTAGDPVLDIGPNFNTHIKSTVSGKSPAVMERPYHGFVIFGKKLHQ